MEKIKSLKILSFLNIRDLYICEYISKLQLSQFIRSEFIENENIPVDKYNIYLINDLENFKSVFIQNNRKWNKEVYLTDIYQKFKPQFKFFLSCNYYEMDNVFEVFAAICPIFKLSDINYDFDVFNIPQLIITELFEKDEMIEFEMNDIYISLYNRNKIICQIEKPKYYNYKHDIYRVIIPIYKDICCLSKNRFNTPHIYFI